MSNSGIYIHIPFCRNRCSYCDFYITTRTDLMERYIDNLIKEIGLDSKNYRNETYNSIYIGGGTPSLLTPEQVSIVISTIKNNYKIDNESEITLEINPEDTADNESRIREYRNAGINRISFGLQSINANELKFLNRYDDTEKISTALIKTLRHFNNTSVDIIYSIPGSTKEYLKRTINKVISLKVPHISAYTLIFEKNTLIYKDLEMKRVKRNTDEKEAELYDYLSEMLTKAGYNHYEISNYALPGFESQHNIKYWEYENYTGFGASSHSFYYPKRWKNYSNIIKYNLSLENNILPIEKTEILTPEECEREIIFLGLRSKGVNLNKFREITGKYFDKEYSKVIETLEKGNFGISDTEYFRLTQEGYRIADEIVTKYFL
jgi:oxygen-independent coproporphyrinogen-3 oxidase